MVDRKEMHGPNGKTKKVTISVSDKELTALEHMLTCWIVCNKGKRIVDDDIELYKHQYSCKQCQTLLKQTQKLARNIESRLWSAYIDLESKK